MNNYISMNKQPRHLRDAQADIDNAIAEYEKSGKTINVLAINTVQDIKTQAAARVNRFGTF